MQGFWKGIESTQTFLHLKQLFLINNPAERCPAEMCSLGVLKFNLLITKRVFLLLWHSSAEILGNVLSFLLFKKYLDDDFWRCPLPGMDNKVVVIVEIKTWPPWESVMRTKSCSYRANPQQVWEEDWESSGWKGHWGSHFEGAFLRSLLWLLGQVPGKAPEGFCPS